jgi:hypothetical protein
VQIDVNRSDDKSWWSVMKYRKNRLRHNTLDSIIHNNFLNLNKQLARRDGKLLDLGFYDTETWGGLRKCWKGYKIAKSEDSGVQRSEGLYIETSLLFNLLIFSITWRGFVVLSFAAISG